MREYVLKDIDIGMKESFSQQITDKMEDAFRNVTGDENPLHFDDQYAVEIGKGKYRKHIVFGMLTASFLSTMAVMIAVTDDLELLKFLCFSIVIVAK